MHFRIPDSKSLRTPVYSLIHSVPRLQYKSKWWMPCRLGNWVGSFSSIVQLFPPLDKKQSMGKVIMWVGFGRPCHLTSNLRWTHAQGYYTPPLCNHLPSIFWPVERWALMGACSGQYGITQVPYIHYFRCKNVLEHFVFLLPHKTLEHLLQYQKACHVACRHRSLHQFCPVKGWRETESEWREWGRGSEISKMGALNKAVAWVAIGFKHSVSISKTWCTSDDQVCNQRLSSAFDLLLTFLCSLIKTLTLTPPPYNALLANMDMWMTHTVP